MRKSKRTATRTSGQMELSPSKIPKHEDNLADRVFEYVIEEIQQDGVTTTTTQIETLDGHTSGLVLSLNNSVGNVISLPIDNEQKPNAESADTPEDEYSMDSVSLAKSVKDLLDLLVDSATLKKFGWPTSPVEYVSSFAVTFRLGFLKTGFFFLG